MKPIDLIKQPIIFAEIKDANGLVVSTRSYFKGSPIQPVGNNVLVLVSHKPNLLEVANTDANRPSSIDWITCKLVAKGEYVHSLNVGDNLFIIPPMRSNGFTIKDPDNSSTTASKNKIITIGNANLPIVYEYILFDASQITATFDEPTSIVN